MTLPAVLMFSVAGLVSAARAQSPIGTGWTANPPIPEIRGVAQGATVASADGSRIYYVGGACCSSYPDAIDRVWIYSPDKGSWSRAADIPVVTGLDPFGAVAEMNGFIYVFGGFTGPALAGSILNTTWIYDEANDFWFEGSNMPDYRAASAAATDGTVVWIIGGYNDAFTGHSTDTVWSYDPATDTYRTDFDPMPVSSGRLHAVELPNGDIHVFTSVNQHFVYDTESNHWFTQPPMDIRVLDPAVVTDGTLIYVAGGSGPVPRAEGWTQIYNPASFVWSQGPRMPAPAIDNTTGTIIDGVLYVIGGYDGAAPISFNYSLELQPWK